MTDQLTGRALDEACALAMGWIPDDCPAYSIDPSLLDDKLAWLRAQLNTVSIELIQHHDAEWEWSVTIECRKLIGYVSGSTLHEATARLVVAVAKETS